MFSGKQNISHILKNYIHILESINLTFTHYYN